jgi:hypothetical protein
VYVDERDQVWLSDFGSNALVRFDPTIEQFTSFPLPTNPGDVRQIPRTTRRSVGRGIRCRQARRGALLIGRRFDRPVAPAGFAKDFPTLPARTAARRSREPSGLSRVLKFG